ncbi:MAG: lipid A deacylase LpxR family protein [Planctomycetota bacterium]
MTEQANPDREPLMSRKRVVLDRWLRYALTIFAAVASVACPGFVWAQSDAPQTPADAEADRVAEQIADSLPEPYRFRIVWNNDGSFFNPFGNDDRHYSNGTQFEFASQPEWARDLARWTPGGDFYGEQELRTAGGFLAGHQLYTPEQLTVAAPLPDDRPHASYLYGGFFWQRDNLGGPPNSGGPDGIPTLDHFELQFGVAGEGALGEPIQRTVHDTFSGDEPNGWDNQNRTEGVIQGVIRKDWRLEPGPVATPLGNLEWQAIPSLRARVGTAFIDGEVGGLVRVGVGLPDDFGPGGLFRVPSATGLSPAYSEEGRFSAYVFGRASGRAVGHNLFLGGSLFRNNQVVVEPERFVGEVEAGLAVRYEIEAFFAEVTWSVVANTEEFEGQDGGNEFGNLSLNLGCTF